MWKIIYSKNNLLIEKKKFSSLTFAKITNPISRTHLVKLKNLIIAIESGKIGICHNKINYLN